MPNRTSRIAGFSLIELLVVIGIIVILIGILIPTIAGVRRSAWAADTKNLISQMSSAIERYYQEHHAYPGIFSNRQIATGVRINGTTFETGAADKITMTENMMLSLVGGTKFNGSALSGLDYDVDALRQSRGVVSANPANPKRYAAYMNVTDKMLSPGSATDLLQCAGMHDSIIPEILDTWPLDDQLPVIYLRANVGAPGIISDAGAPADYQYDLAFITPYLRAGKDGLSGLGAYGDPVDDTARANAISYFAHPSVGATNNASGTPREKDRFVLIAAGKDRIYGTKDDIVNWGSR
ncbi:MAG: prepilin-type N-terminal cleavage/methylation domain-containing protein [Phycisphaerales bacterium]|nr:prepilin-type N-terminal cleavage/methylation domain-containing protein [Phycisphaerales bacterium]